MIGSCIGFTPLGEIINIGGLKNTSSWAVIVIVSVVLKQDNSKNSGDECCSNVEWIHRALPRGSTSSGKMKFSCG